MDWKLFSSNNRTTGILSNTELCYAQIEKETLALTWALEKFLEYIIDKVIH